MVPTLRLRRAPFFATRNRRSRSGGGAAGAGVEGFFFAVADLAPAAAGDLRTGLDGVGCGGGGVPGMLGLEFSDVWEDRAREGQGVLAAAGAWGLVGVLAAAAAGPRGLVGVFAAAAVDIARVWRARRAAGIGLDRGFRLVGGWIWVDEMFPCVWGTKKKGESRGGGGGDGKRERWGVEPGGVTASFFRGAPPEAFE
jgi:hypothetical protein